MDVEQELTRGRNCESGEDVARCSKERIARELMRVKDNLLVIRMDVAGLTRWGTSWRRERVCGRRPFERAVEKFGAASGTEIVRRVLEC